MFCLLSLIFFNIHAQNLLSEEYTVGADHRSFLDDHSCIALRVAAVFS